MQLPQPLLNDLQFVNGFDRAAFIAAHQQPAQTSVRLHSVKTSGLFKENEKVPWCDAGRYLETRPVFTLDPLYHIGAYYVQEASSMFLDHMLRSLLPKRNGLRVLDLCAAPGGKSTLIASLLGRDDLLIANEVIRTRTPVLAENLSRWGYMNTWVTSNDAKDFGKLQGYFDVIVIDAPCSGSGLFRKDAAALNEWSENNVSLCSHRQQRILADVWPALKDDGLLIYATCSYSQQEDEDIVDWLSDELGAESVAVGIKDEWGVTSVITDKNKMQAYRFFPGKVKGEGFFIVAMRKCDAVDMLRVPKFRTQQDKKVFEQAVHLLKETGWSCVKRNTETYHAINSGHEVDLQLLSGYLNFYKTGVELGAPSQKGWVPAHDTALSIDRSPALPVIEVDKDAALKFLKKEEFELPVHEKGWVLVQYDGLALGWIKSFDNRFNNYLPKNWRIRMEIPDS